MTLTVALSKGKLLAGGFLLVLFETSIAKMRVFRVPQFVGTALMLGLLGTLLLFGLACLNYTKAGGLEHHREFAAQHHLPPPSEPILYGGVLSTVVGAALVGFRFGAARSGLNKTK